MAMRREYWTLLAINAAKENGLSPVQLQKSLFLLGAKLSDQVEDAFYHFVPYNYGPFDPDVYQDAELLARQGYVEIVRSQRQRWSMYKITAAGRTFADEIRIEAPVKAVEYLEKVVPWTQQLTFEQLVRAIYKMYPAYRANSVFQY